MTPITQEAIKTIFTEARTYPGWLPDEVSNETLKQVYDLMKFGPTSANTCPARIVFVKAGPEKEKLLSCLMETNVAKVKEAPVTAIIAMDMEFYEKIPKLWPHGPGFRDLFAGNAALAEVTAMRNSSLQGAYFIIAARAAGLDCGPMSGFDNAKLDEAFFAGTKWKSNFICNIGHGDPSKLMPRLPRLDFEEACKIV